MSGITICAEANTAASETFEGSERRIVAGFPRFINLQRSLTLIHVTRAFHTEAPVNFVATVSAIAADETVKSGFNRGHGIFRFAENPHLEHVTRFPVFGGIGKARGDDDAMGVLMKNKAVQREPPTRSSATQ